MVNDGSQHLTESIRILTANRNRCTQVGFNFPDHSTMVKIRVLISKFTMARSLLNKHYIEVVAKRERG